MTENATFFDRFGLISTFAIARVTTLSRSRKLATITKRGDRWLVQVRRKGVPSINRTFKAQADAKAWAALEEARIERAEPVSPRKMLSSVTYGDILHRYGEEVTPQKRSAATELQRIRQLQADPLSILPLANLDGNAVAAYRDRRLLKVKSGTVRRELAIISHTLEIARKEWGFRLPSNPVKDIRQPAIGRGRNRRLEAGEWKRLVAASAACRNNRLLPFIRLAVETAMRRSELIALRWDHVDLCRATLHIPVTKNGNSRTIPLTDEARAILLSLKGSEGSIFGMTTNAFKLAWTRIVQRSGLLDLHFHDLRHEAISRFAEMGLSTMELAVISGHRDLRMLQRYTHLRPSDLARKLAGRSWESEVGSPS